MAHCGPNALDILRDAGVVLPDNIARIVLDISINEPVKIYYETIAEDKAVEALFSLPGLRELPLNKLHANNS